MSQTGSEMKFGDRDPRVCCLCHRRVTLSGRANEGVTFYHAGPVHLAWHVGCGQLADALASTKGV